MPPPHPPPLLGGPLAAGPSGEDRLGRLLLGTARGSSCLLWEDISLLFLWSFIYEMPVWACPVILDMSCYLRCVLLFERCPVIWDMFY